jgi:hypothetical protein
MEKELAEQLKKELLPKIKGEKLTKVGVSHTIVDIEIKEIALNQFTVLVLGEDKGSGTRFITESLYTWLSENRPELLDEYVF